MNQSKTLGMAQMAMFVTLIIVLAFVPYIGYIRIPILAIQATTVHIPVIIGSVLLGPKKGAFLGFVFGLTSLINNTMQPGITSFCFSPFVEIAGGMGGSPLALIICFVPRILCGTVPYYVFKAFSKKTKTKSSNKTALIISGICGSLCNTILVMSMIYIFFGHQYALARDISYEAVSAVILSVVAVNGTIEAIIAGLLTSAIAVAILKTGFVKE